MLPGKTTASAVYQHGRGYRIEEHEDRTLLPSGPLATSEMLPHLQICHPCECGKDPRSVAGKHMVPVRVVTRSKERMIEIALKLAIFLNNAEH